MGKKLKFITFLCGAVLLISCSSKVSQIETEEIGAIIKLEQNEKLFSMGRFKNGEEIVSLYSDEVNKNINEVNKNDISLYKYNKEKDEMVLLEKATKGYIIAKVRVFDDLVVWNEFEEKAKTAENGNFKETKYILKYKRLGEDTVEFGKGAVDETNYGGIQDFVYDGKNIGYNISQPFGTDSIEVYNLENKKIISSFKTEARVNNIYLENGKITFSIIEGKNSKIYCYDVDSQPKELIKIKNKIIEDPYLYKGKIYFNYNEGIESDEGLAPMIGVNTLDINTLKEEELFKYGKAKEDFAKGNIRIRYINGENIYIRSWSSKDLIYKIKENKFQVYESEKEYFDKNTFEEYLSKG